MKLIKLNEQHYIIVDNSEIKEDQCYVGWETDYATEPKNRWVIYYKSIECNGNPHYKVTHSFGKHLEEVDNRPLSEVEEVIYGYSLEKMAEHSADDAVFQDASLNYAGFYKGYINGFKAHQELVKDKLFTVEQLYTAFSCGRTYEKSNRQGVGQSELVDYIKSLEKTEWDVEFDEQGKIVLL